MCCWEARRTPITAALEMAGGGQMQPSGACTPADWILQEGCESQVAGMWRCMWRGISPAAPVDERWIMGTAHDGEYFSGGIERRRGTGELELGRACGLLPRIYSHCRRCRVRLGCRHVVLEHRLRLPSAARGAAAPVFPPQFDARPPKRSYVVSSSGST